jgi:hypothetical protein
VVFSVITRRSPAGGCTSVQDSSTPKMGVGTKDGNGTSEQDRRSRSVEGSAERPMHVMQKLL